MILYLFDLEPWTLNMDPTVVFFLLLHVVLHHSFIVAEASDNMDKPFSEPQATVVNSQGQEKKADTLTPGTDFKDTVNKISELEKLLGNCKEELNASLNRISELEKSWGNHKEELNASLNRISELEKSWGNHKEELNASLNRISELEKSWGNHKEELNASLKKVNETVSETVQSHKNVQVNYTKFQSEHLQLNKSISDFKEQLKTLSETESQIQKQLSRSESYFNLTDKEINANLTQLRSEIDKINTWKDKIVQSLQDQLMELMEAQKMTVTVAKFVNLETDLHRRTDELNNKVEKLMSDTKEQDDLFSKDFELQNNNLKELNVTQKLIETKVGALETTLQETETKLNDRLDQSESDKQDNNKAFNGRLELQSEKLEEMLKTQRRLEEELKELRGKFEHSEEQQNQKIRQTYTRTVEIESDVKNNQGLSEMLSYVVVAFTSMIVAYAFLSGGFTFGQTKTNFEEEAITHSSHKNEPTMPEELATLTGEVPLVQQEIDDEALCPAVCSLGFSESAISTFGPLTQAICPEGMTVHTYVVHSTVDLADAPKDALALVFVDFNERNVILEQPGLLQGELKTKTVQHLLQTGADVFVIYTGDNESENLPEGALYNTSLSSVHKHSLLKPLQKRQRVLSILTAFNEAQELVLSKAINKLCQS
ncbi:myosin-4-like isoform X2 [Liolophura sinensis]|uniref:myosin-4-like isoform X2 n=1 Tax=Liolophura sinensis TaxID=3198878 RepID=UPI0031581575